MAPKLAGLLGSVLEATVTPHPVDRYLELFDPMLTWRATRAKVTRVQHQTDRSVTLTLTPTRQWRGHVAGEYIQVGVVIDGVRHKRCFSPANAEQRRGEIELNITAHPDGLVSKFLRDTARPGLVVDLEAASGTFRLPSPRPVAAVFISGGSGISPVLSMLRTLVTEGYERPITFVHYARTPDDVPYREQLASIGRTLPNIDLRLFYTRTEDGGGRFRPEHLDGVEALDSAEIFVCGPAELQDAVADFHAAAGLTTPLHSEAFVVAEFAAPDPDDQEGELRFAASGGSVANDGRTILEQAEAAGLSPEHGCRMGICFSCNAVKRSGCTRNLLTGELDTESDKHIQICVNAPVGDVEIEV